VARARPLDERGRRRPSPGLLVPAARLSGRSVPAVRSRAVPAAARRRARPRRRPGWPARPT
jgi:hypothetical protein